MVELKKNSYQGQFKTIETDIPLLQTTKILIKKPGKIFRIIIAAIFLSEALVMFILNILPPLPIYMLAFFDAILLSAIVFPIIYFYLIRPLYVHIDEYEQVERALRSLSHKLLNAHEEERHRIGVELHDGLAQNLSSIKIWAESVLTQLERNNLASVPNSLEKIVPLSQEAVEEVRRIIGNLRPTVLDDLGLISAISWLLKEFEKAYDWISIEREIDVKEDDLPDALKIVIFRVMQEALNNISKHSQANLVHISLKKTEEKIELNINDNGTGFDVRKMFSGEQSLIKGIGITSMSERTKLSGGSFSINSKPDRGTTIQASWILSDII